MFPRNGSARGPGDGWRALVRSTRALLARTPALGPAVRFADHWALRRGQDARPAFPFLRRVREHTYQVLVLHRVGNHGNRYVPPLPVDLFRRHMETLTAFRTVLPLLELVERARARDVPPGAVAVTFDDGYRDNYENAFPVLRRLGLPATIFLATEGLDEQAPLWHDRVFDLFARAGRESLVLDQERYAMVTELERKRSLHLVLHRLRRRRPSERDARIEDLRRQAGCGAENVQGALMLTWRQVDEMSRAGISFGAHTVSHPILTRLTPEEAEAEIRGSREAIERRIPVPVRLFAYPNGGPEDFDRRIQEIVRGAGFAAAATTIWGNNGPDTDPFAIRRVGAWDADPRAGLLRLGWYRFALGAGAP